MNKVPENLIWLLWSLGLVCIESVLFLLNREMRRRMLWASLLTMPFGLTEPIFVPEYWIPPTLFNLAQRTGFDIESLIFSFGIGGLGIVSYEFLFKVRHEKMNWTEKHLRRHRYHLWTLISPAISFLLLYFLTDLNPIYDAIFSMFLGGAAAIWCRPDLKTKIGIGGIIFTLFYFVYFFLLDLLSPGYVEKVWRLSELSGILVFRVPLEELLFAFTFGMLWSSYYEHIQWYKLKAAQLP